MLDELTEREMGALVDARAVVALAAELASAAGLHTRALELGETAGILLELWGRAAQSNRATG
jgi:hypothetical protein